jgi:hypothetical protein
MSLHWTAEDSDGMDGRWRWRRLADLPADGRRNRRGKQDYIEVLENRDVFEGLTRAQVFLGEWYDNLEFKGTD